jgi:hypothetical protein
MSRPAEDIGHQRLQLLLEMRGAQTVKFVVEVDVEKTGRKKRTCREGGVGICVLHIDRKALEVSYTTKSGGETHTWQLLA